MVNDLPVGKTSIKVLTPPNPLSSRYSVQNLCKISTGIRSSSVTSISAARKRTTSAYKIEISLMAVTLHAHWFELQSPTPKILFRQNPGKARLLGTCNKSIQTSKCGWSLRKVIIVVLINFRLTSWDAYNRFSNILVSNFYGTYRGSPRAMSLMSRW